MMEKLILFFFLIIFSNFRVYGVPIETPEFDERNEFVIKSPAGWGYRTFNGKNGLIGALWPSGTSFNSADTAVFIFLQNSNEEIPRKPDNINLFTEKCPKAKFKFSSSRDNEDETLSIAERYFSGRCGRTMILFKENVDNYTVVIALVSSKYVSKKQLTDVKIIALSYKKEIEKYIKGLSNSDDEEQDDSTENDENQKKNSEEINSQPIQSAKESL
ncbi:MAG: hypothetical protein LBO02_03515 [Holosporaceae bacterium]|jgi:hypothetical protein|nr:hypothetical protein [Holosporaceae bacterium]